MTNPPRLPKQFYFGSCSDEGEGAGGSILKRACTCHHWWQQ